MDGDCESSDVSTGTWYRSFEEEQVGASDHVYRPSTYSFPPRRAPRPALRFGSEGVTAFGPGPDDRPLDLGEPEPFTVVSASPDLLVVRPKLSQEGPS